MKLVRNSTNYVEVQTFRSILSFKANNSKIDNNTIHSIKISILKKGILLIKFQVNFN